MTFERLTLVGQRLAGIRNQGNILASRGLQSTNRVPAIVAEGANSMISLLDSTLAGGRPIFENRDSRIVLVYGTNVDHANQKLHILVADLLEAAGQDVLQEAADEFVGGHGHGAEAAAAALALGERDAA